MLDGEQLWALVEAAQRDDWATVGLVYLGLAGETPNREHNAELARLAACLRRRDADNLAQLVKMLTAGDANKASKPVPE
jgi:hypothetical protein